MTAIKVTCRRCGREVNSAECDSQLRCTLCVALSLVSQLLSQYEKLWAKRNRYRRAGAPHKALEEQIGRLAIRISTRLHERIANRELAARTLNSALEHARQRADTAGGKIVVPRSGQEIVGSGARA